MTTNNISNKELISDLKWVFYDELKDIPLELQKKILSVLVWQWLSHEQRLVLAHRVLHETDYYSRIIKDKMWLWDDLLISFDKKLHSTKFIEKDYLFNFLRDFIIQNYDFLDLVVYRKKKNSNSLKFFSWNENYSMDFDLSKISQNELPLELKALYCKNRNFKTEQINSLDKINWALASFKVSMSDEDFVLAFYLKQDLIDVNENTLKIELSKLQNFCKSKLSEIIFERCNAINSTYTDWLTKVFNKEYINNISAGHKYSFVYIDLDEFKTINDTFWHNVWDEILLFSVELLKKSIRENDKIVRLWWDEFWVLVQSNDLNYLNELRQRIYENFNKFKYKDKTSNTDIKIGLSIGIMPYENWKNISELISWADKNMYLEKKQRKLNKLNLFSRLKYHVSNFFKSELKNKELNIKSH